MSLHSNDVRNGLGSRVVGRRQASAGDNDTVCREEVAGRNDLNNTVTGRGHCDGCNVLMFARRWGAISGRRP